MLKDRADREVTFVHLVAFVARGLEIPGHDLRDAPVVFDDHDRSGHDFHDLSSPGGPFAASFSQHRSGSGKTGPASLAATTDRAPVHNIHRTFVRIVAEAPSVLKDDADARLPGLAARGTVHSRVGIGRRPDSIVRTRGLG